MPELFKQDSRTGWLTGRAPVATSEFAGTAGINFEFADSDYEQFSDSQQFSTADC